MSSILLALITAYQKTVSPDHGLFRYKYPYGFCRYSPSCSDYAKHAIQKRGALRGVTQSLGRILRCNPFSKGGHDPIH